MNTKTLKALQGSIKKWEGILAGKIADEGPTNCPLCKMFWDTRSNRDEVLCNGCPVFEKTGEHGCKLTPYDSWSDEDYQVVVDETSKSYALAELNFLKSLLPSTVLACDVKCVKENKL